MGKIIYLNGNKHEVPNNVSSVEQLLTHLALDHRMLIVEINQLVLTKEAYTQSIQDHDRIEIIHFVGGG